MFWIALSSMMAWVTHIVWLWKTLLVFVISLLMYIKQIFTKGKVRSNFLSVGEWNESHPWFFFFCINRSLVMNLFFLFQFVTLLNFLKVHQMGSGSFPSRWWLFRIGLDIWTMCADFLAWRPLQGWSSISESLVGICKCLLCFLGFRHISSV